MHMTEASETPARVLIAEDDRTIARRLKQILVSAGHEVIDLVDTVVGAKEALSPPPDLLLLDIGLDHDTAGLDLAESDAIPEETALIFVSARTDDATFARVQAIAPAGFVVKPFTERQVEAAVRVGLGRSGGGAPAEPSADLAQDLAVAREALQKIAVALQQAGHLVAGGFSDKREIRNLPRLSQLSPREWDVLRLLVDHKRPPAIAKELHISHHTVRNHLKSIFAKLRVHSQVELLELVLGPADD